MLEQSVSEESKDQQGGEPREGNRALEGSPRIWGLSWRQWEAGGSYTQERGMIRLAF